ncbi:MAG: tetratricopeptide repeat protein, partial [Bacteroidota bacterium]
MGNISLIHIHSTTGLAAVWTLGRTVVLLCLLLYAAHSGKAQTSAHDMQEPTLEEIYQQARKHKNKDPQKSKDYALRALRGGRKTGDSAYIGKVLNVLGAVEMSLGHQEKALVYLEEALGKGKGKDRAVTLTTIGTLYYNRCQFRKAKVYYEKALHVFRTLGNPNAIASCWSNIGLAYKGMYAYEKAVENYLKALSIKESLSMGQQGKVGGTDKIMNNIGEVYLLMGDDSTALEYFNKSLVLQERIGLEKNLVYTYTFIGSVYEHRGELHRALDRYKKALDISRALPFAEGQAFAATNLGITYGKLGDWQQAEQYQEEALHWNTQLSDPQSSARNWLSLAEIAYAKGRYRKALENIATAASLVGSEGTHHLHVDMYRLQADIAEHLGQYRQAYAYSKMEKALSDSLAKANNTQRIFQLRNNYASEKIALLEKDRELKVMQISKAKLFNNAAIAVAFLLVLVIFMLLRSHRRKMRNNLIIKAKNEEINRQKIKDLVWEQQIKSIQANIEGQESEKKRIAKELHDGLGATLSTIKLNLQRREGAIA